MICDKYRGKNTGPQCVKNEYQDTPGGKDDQCVRLTTYHLQVPMSRNQEALISQNPIRLQWGYFTFLPLFESSFESMIFQSPNILELYMS
jgi:hypothetical protein